MQTHSHKRIFLSPCLIGWKYWLSLFMRLDMIDMVEGFHNLYDYEGWSLISYNGANANKLGQVIPQSGLCRATWLLLVDY